MFRFLLYSSVICVFITGHRYVDLYDRYVYVVIPFVYYRNGSIVFVSSIGGFVPLPVSLLWYIHIRV